MPSHYSTLPSYTQWLRDSSIAIGIRGQDPVLKQIDNLMDALNRDRVNGESLYLYGELFFATNYWLRNFKSNPHMKSGREGSVLSLFAFAARKLESGFKCTLNTLPNKLEEYYGKSMTAHGIRQDSRQNLGTRHYMDRAATNRFKILFKQGIAYQSEWGKPNPRIIRVNSVFWRERTADIKVLKEEFAHFVMSMSRDIYMGPHMVLRSKGLGKGAVVHSSWLAGTPVQCAGSMLIDNGIVRGIQNNSGHYQPTDDHMVNVLELLKTVGVKLDDVDVYDYKGNNLLPGNKFLENRGNWEAILKRKGVKDQQSGTGPMPSPQPPGSKPKKKYRCTNCNRIYEESYAVWFCQYCKSVCRPV